jgi:hypothetical protein
MYLRLFLIASAIAAFASIPARADTCMQLDGAAFSGDLGFFRFKGDLPTDPGKIVALKGRIAGLSPVFGTATVAKDGSYVEVGATFFADATQGQIDLAFFPPANTTGSGDGNYGSYGTGTSFTVKRVSCAKEP